MRTIPLALVLFPLAAFAQSPKDSLNDDIKLADFRDSTYYNILLENAPGLRNEPDVPRFAIVGKERRFYMGVGATLTTVAAYDFGNPIPDVNHFEPKNIPMSIAPGNGGEFRVSAQQSQFYINIVALPGQKNQLGAFVNVKFLGDNYSPTLDHAYLKYRGIIAGRTFSAFTDQAANPPSIDHMGPNASTTTVHGMISYEPFFGRNHEWRAGIGFDQPEESYTLTSATAHVNQRVPDIPFYVQRSWLNGRAWFRLSGIVRNIIYRDLDAGRNRDVLGWGMKATGRTPIAGGLQFSGLAVYGKGIAGYIQGLRGEGLDLTPDPSNPAKLNPVKAWAGFASLQYTFSYKCFATATYSMVRNYAEPYQGTDNPWADSYKYGQYVNANFFYNFNSIVQFGVEYLYGRRVDHSGLQAHDSRLQAMLRVSF